MGSAFITFIASGHKNLCCNITFLTVFLICKIYALHPNNLKSLTSSSISSKIKGQISCYRWLKSGTIWHRYDSHYYKGPFQLKTCKSRWNKSFQNPKHLPYDLSLKPMLWTGEPASLDLLAPQEIKESCTEYGLEQLQKLSYSELQHKKSSVLGSLNKQSILIHQKWIHCISIQKRLLMEGDQMQHLSLHLPEYLHILHFTRLLETSPVLRGPQESVLFTSTSGMLPPYNKQNNFSCLVTRSSKRNRFHIIDSIVTWREIGDELNYDIRLGWGWMHP